MLLLLRKLSFEWHLSVILIVFNPSPQPGIWGTSRYIHGTHSWMWHTYTIKATPTFLLIFSYILHPSSSSFIFPFTIGMNYTQASSWKMLAPHSTHTLDSQLFGESIKTVLYIYHKLSLLPRHFPHLKLEQPLNTGGIDRLCVRTSETSSVVPRWCEQVCYICTYNLTIRDNKGWYLLCKHPPLQWHQLAYVGRAV